MAMARVDKASLKGHLYDGLGPDHLQLEANPCGVIMELKLDNDWQATSARVGAAPAPCVPAIVPHAAPHIGDVFLRQCCTRLISKLTYAIGWLCCGVSGAAGWQHQD
jgi:hypothetical protein